MPKKLFTAKCAACGSTNLYLSGTYHCNDCQNTAILFSPLVEESEPKEVCDLTLKELANEEWWDNATIIDTCEAAIYLHKIAKKVNEMNDKMKKAIDEEGVKDVN